MSDFHNITTGTPWRCTCCHKETKSIYYINGQILCDGCYASMYCVDEDFDITNKKQLKEFIKSVIDEYMENNKDVT